MGRAAACGALITAVVMASPAMAGKKPFAGALEVNDAPITFEAKKRKGRYREIPLFNVGDINTGVPVECEGVPQERSFQYGGVDIKRDQTINENDAFMYIKARFKSKSVLRGTIKIDGEGQGSYCTSNGKLTFKATLET